MKKSLLLAASILAASLAPSGAFAGASTRPAITIAVEDEVLWVSASIEDARDIEIRLMAPKRSGTGRRLFQSCRFNFSGAGEYGCGLDITAGSQALPRSGVWLAKLVVGREAVAKRAFSV